MPYVLDCLFPPFRRILALLAECDVEWCRASTPLPRSPSSSLNPARAEADVKVHQDRLKIRMTCQLILDGVLDQQDSIPRPLRKLCHFIHDLVHDLVVQGQTELERSEAAKRSLLVPPPPLSVDVFHSQHSLLADPAVDDGLPSRGPSDPRTDAAPPDDKPGAHPLHQQLFVNRAFGTWPLTAKSEDNLSFVIASTGKIKDTSTPTRPAGSGGLSSMGSVGADAGVDSSPETPNTSQAFGSPFSSTTLPSAAPAGDGTTSLALNILSRGEKIMCSLLFLRIIFPGKLHAGTSSLTRAHP